MPAWLRLIRQGFFIPLETRYFQVFQIQQLPVLMDIWGFRFGIVPRYIPFSDPFPPSVAHSAAHGHYMKANMLQYLLTSPSAPVPGSEGRALPANHSEGHSTH